MTLNEMDINQLTAVTQNTALSDSERFKAYQRIDAINAGDVDDAALLNSKDADNLTSTQLISRGLKKMGVGANKSLAVGIGTGMSADNNGASGNGDGNAGNSAGGGTA